MHGAEMFAWIIMTPHDRWNMRNEKGALRACYLVIVQLHRIRRPAAELVVLRIGAEGGGQQNARLRALGMGCD